MKKILWLLFGVVSGTYAQNPGGIRFAEGAWSQMLAEAKAQNRLIFVDIFTTWCGPCKIMDTRVFSKAEIGEKFNTSFINFRIDAEKGEGIALAKRYAVDAYPNYLFVNAYGDLVYRITGAMPAQKLLAEADKAIAVGANFKPSGRIETEYAAGNREPAFLYEFLQRKELNGEKAPVILEEYLKAIPESAYKTEKVLKVISENVSSIDSKAFEILADALKRFMNMTREQQKYVLDGISEAKRNTFRLAVAQRDKILFERLIVAVKRTAYSDAGFEAEERQFRLDFARITHDADNFRIIASKDAVRLMEKTTGQLAVESQQRKDRFVKNAETNGIDESTSQYKAALADMENNAEKLTAFRLNEYAYGYFQLIDNKEELLTALKWAERSIELFLSPVNLDTKARLLAKLGKRKEAIKAEKAAIKLAKRQGVDKSGFQHNLEEIKNMP